MKPGSICGYTLELMNQKYFNPVVGSSEFMSIIDAVVQLPIRRDAIYVSRKCKGNLKSRFIDVSIQARERTRKIKEMAR
jgi:hypothetical protein